MNKHFAELVVLRVTFSIIGFNSRTNENRFFDEFTIDKGIEK